MFAEEYVRHELRPTQALPEPAGQKKIADDFRAAFPDLDVTVDLIVGEEDFRCRPLDGLRHPPRPLGRSRPLFA